MSDVTVRLDGLAQAIRNLKSALGGNMYQKVSMAIRKVGQSVVRDAKQMCPVKTGRLAGSISINWAGSGMGRGDVTSKAHTDDGIGQPEGAYGLVVVVGTNVFYGPYVEYGHMAGRELQFFVDGTPFLSSAKRMHEGDVLPAVVTALAKALK